MSETVTYIGKMREIKVGESKSLNDVAKEILTKYGENVSEMPPYYDSYEEWLRDSYYKDFMVIKGRLFEVIENEKMDEYGFSIATANEDGTISFAAQYYNGSTSLEEALEEAIENVQ
jgi:hypothetical protein